MSSGRDGLAKAVAPNDDSVLIPRKNAAWRALSRLGSDVLLHHLFVGLGLRGLGAVSAFLLTLVIARAFGPEALGGFQFALATAALCSTIGLLGADLLLVRNVSARLGTEDRTGMRDTFRLGRMGVLARGGALSILLLAASWPVGKILQSVELVPFLLALAPVAATTALLRYHSALLRVLGKVYHSQMLEGVSYTTLAVLALALVHWVNPAVSPLLAPWLYTAFTLATLVYAWHAVDRIVSRWPAGSGTRMQVGDGMSVAAPTVIMVGSEWAILFFVTAWLGLGDTAVFRTAFQIAALFQLVNASFAMMAAPHTARAAKDRDVGALPRLVGRIGALGLVVVALPLLVILLFGSEILGLFGGEFEAGRPALIVLVVGQVFNVACGPIGQALVMIDRERTGLVIEIISSGLGFLVAVALLAPLGILGAATGMMCAAIARNALAWIVLLRMRKTSNRSSAS